MLTGARYEYVRLFEQPDALLPNTFIVVRIDGRGFSKYLLPHFLVNVLLPSCPRSPADGAHLQPPAHSASLGLNKRFPGMPVC